jgi:hypothetical protein
LWVRVRSAPCELSRQLNRRIELSPARRSLVSRRGAGGHPRGSQSVPVYAERWRFLADHQLTLDTDTGIYGYMVHWVRTSGPGQAPKFYPVSKGQQRTKQGGDDCHGRRNVPYLHLQRFSSQRTMLTDAASIAASCDRPADSSSPISSSTDRPGTTEKSGVE